eukprot:m.247539 g.247539  ORF g.247539 m.247539 type:complete len:229 (-) comp19497_c0_seq12:726-1412(-)
MAQASSSDFDEFGQGHDFVLRNPLAKTTARKCVECSEDIYARARHEVTDADLLTVLNVTAEASATEILPKELLIGGFKAVIAETNARPEVVVINCAGKRLHTHLPKTRAPYDALRARGRMLDFEWEDHSGYPIPEHDIATGISWARARVSAGSIVLCACAQGKSRSGTMATAYIMATKGMRALEALAFIQKKRPFTKPNAGFLRQLSGLEGRMHGSELAVPPIPHSKS